MVPIGFFGFGRIEKGILVGQFLAFCPNNNSPRDHPCYYCCGGLGLGEGWDGDRIETTRNCPPALHSFAFRRWPRRRLRRPMPNPTSSYPMTAGTVQTAHAYTHENRSRVLHASCVTRIPTIRNPHAVACAGPPVCAPPSSPSLTPPPSETHAQCGTPMHACDRRAVAVGGDSSREIVTCPFGRACGRE